MIKDNIIFLQEFITEFQTTGSFFATSSKAARALCSSLNSCAAPRRILEIGPGTGSVTRQILKKMGPNDTLAICEINPRFMAELKKKLDRSQDFQKSRSKISFHECPIQELVEDTKFDVIICSLPFLNFDLKTVKEIFDKLQRLGTEAAVMTFYQYIGLRSIGKVVGSSEDKKRMALLDSFFEDKTRKQSAECKKVWLNVLPINVYTLKLAA